MVLSVDATSIVFSLIVTFMSSSVFYISLMYTHRSRRILIFLELFSEIRFSGDYKWGRGRGEVLFEIWYFFETGLEDRANCFLTTFFDMTHDWTLAISVGVIHWSHWDLDHTRMTRRDYSDCYCYRIDGTSAPLGLQSTRGPSILAHRALMDADAMSISIELVKSIL